MNPVEYFEYCPETGNLFWKPREGKDRAVTRFNRMFAGRVAGTRDRHGYIAVNIRAKLYRAHRIAWFLAHGAWPEADIDHVNGDRSDNRLVNLRAATRGENHQNKAPSKNSTGLTGVYQDRKWWASKICKDRKVIWLGRFNTPEEAHAAYVNKKAEIHTFNPVLRKEPAE